MTTSPVRPRDAAGLVLLKPGRDGLTVLMGRRHRKARFMPGVLVFPGGCLEASDHRPSGFQEAFHPPPEGLDAASRRKLPGLLRCALRETWEETGILVGSSGPAPKTGPDASHWQAFAERGLVPSLQRPRLLARAITPTRSPIRFHTRFFLAVTDQVVDARPGDGELDDVSWIPVEQARQEELIDVTRFVLERAIGPGATDPVPLFHYKEGAHLIDYGGQDSLWRRIEPRPAATGT